MSAFKTSVITAGVVGVLVAILLYANSCAERDQRFRLACVSAGGTFMEFGTNANCIAGGKVVSP